MISRRQLHIAIAYYVFFTILHCIDIDIQHPSFKPKTKQLEINGSRYLNILNALFDCSLSKLHFHIYLPLHVSYFSILGLIGATSKGVGLIICLLFFYLSIVFGCVVTHQP